MYNLSRETIERGSMAVLQTYLYTMKSLCAEAEINRLSIPEVGIHMEFLRRNWMDWF
jgi:hypothetical protein